MAKAAEGLGPVRVDERRDDDARLQPVLDSVADAIIIFDHGGRILRWNRGAERIFGYGAVDIVGTNVTALMPDSHSSPQESPIDLLLHSPGTAGVSRELIGVRRDGSIFPIDITLMEGHAGDSRFITGIVRDITRRKQNEVEL